MSLENVTQAQFGLKMCGNAKENGGASRIGWEAGIRTPITWSRDLGKRCTQVNRPRSYGQILSRPEPKGTLRTKDFAQIRTRVRTPVDDERRARIRLLRGLCDVIATHPTTKRINMHVAGIDCGSAEHYVAVLRIVTRRPNAPSRASRAISTGSRTGSRPRRITSVAMESTGVYWPLRWTRDPLRLYDSSQWTRIIKLIFELFAGHRHGTGSL